MRRNARRRAYPAVAGVMSMHELSIMGNILDIVLDHAARAHAKRISRINLEVGELSDLLPDWMQTYFDFVSRDTFRNQVITHAVSTTLRQS